MSADFAFSHLPSRAGLYDTRGACAYLRETFAIIRQPAYLERLRCTGGGPAFRKIGPRSVVYEAAALDAWVQSITSEPLTSSRRAASEEAA